MHNVCDSYRFHLPIDFAGFNFGKVKHIVDEYVLSERAASRGIFDNGFVRVLVAEHDSGVNHDERIWSLVNFEIWQRRFFDGES